MIHVFVPLPHCRIVSTYNWANLWTLFLCCSSWLWKVCWEYYPSQASTVLCLWRLIAENWIINMGENIITQIISVHQILFLEEKKSIFHNTQFGQPLLRIRWTKLHITLCLAGNGGERRVTPSTNRTIIFFN